VSRIEVQARALWRGWAEWRGFTRCDACGAMRYCGRAARGRRRLCAECWDGSAEAERFLRRVRR
jgi:hypothetical protein